MEAHKSIKSGTKAANSVGRFGLPQSNINFKGLPSAQQIVLNMTQRETTPVAFRIDEVTYSALDLIAKNHGLTLSTFINQLLNSYVEDQAPTKKYVLNNALNIALDKFSKKLSNQTDSQINLNTYGKRELYKLYEYYTGEITPNSKKECEYIAQHFGEFVAARPDNPGCFSISIRPVHKKQATTTDAREWAPEEQHSIAFCDYLLEVPIEKWAVVLSLLLYYEHKLELFYGKNAKKAFANNYESAFGMLKQLVKVINDNSRKKLAPAIARLLQRPTKFDFLTTSVEELEKEY